MPLGGIACTDSEYLSGTQMSQFDWMGVTPFKAGTYIHYTKGYHGSLLTLVTRKNILMDREEALEESEIDLMARETPG